MDSISALILVTSLSSPTKTILFVLVFPLSLLIKFLIIFNKVRVTEPENIIQIKDFEMSKQMAVLSENAQWFEDSAPLMEEHKKKNVVDDGDYSVS